MKPLSRSKDSPTALHQLTFVLQHLADELLSGEAGIGLSQVRILSVLHSSTPHSQLQMARALYQTESNVSRQLKEMKKQGLVNVKRNKKDARQRDVTLTTKGARKAEQGKRLLAAQHKDLLRLMDSAQAKNFDRGIEHLLRALQI
jgi:DNA-binding MarR family transcriptional regulator